MCDVQHSYTITAEERYETCGNEFYPNLVRDRQHIKGNLLFTPTGAQRTQYARYVHQNTI